MDELQGKSAWESSGDEQAAIEAAVVTATKKPDEKHWPKAGEQIVMPLRSDGVAINPDPAGLVIDDGVAVWHLRDKAPP